MTNKEFVIGKLRLKAEIATFHTQSISEDKNASINDYFNALDAEIEAKRNLRKILKNKSK